MDNDIIIGYQMMMNGLDRLFKECFAESRELFMKSDHTDMYNFCKVDDECKLVWKTLHDIADELNIDYEYIKDMNSFKLLCHDLDIKKELLKGVNNG